METKGKNNKKEKEILVLQLLLINNKSSTTLFLYCKKGIYSRTTKLNVVLLEGVAAWHIMPCHVIVQRKPQPSMIFAKEWY